MRQEGESRKLISTSRVEEPSFFDNLPNTFRCIEAFCSSVKIEKFATKFLTKRTTASHDGLLPHPILCISEHNFLIAHESLGQLFDINSLYNFTISKIYFNPSTLPEQVQ